jgi:hypothetical protein
MTMTATNTATLVLTTHERVALSIALKTTLQLWGNSEDAAQERVRKKLQTVLRKLDAVDVSTVAGGK